MKRGFRLKRAADFQKVRLQGKSFKHPLVVLIRIENDLDKVRIGIGAGKTIGNAVSRNRAKRLLRASVSPLISDFQKGYDILLLARQKTINEKSMQIQEAIKELAARAGLMKKND